MATGSKDDPGALQTPPGSSQYTNYRDDEAEPPVLVCQVGSTKLTYDLRAIEDLHRWLSQQGDRVPLGAADDKKPAAEGHGGGVGAIGGKPGRRLVRPAAQGGTRGRFGMYLPPSSLEELGLAELTHDARNNSMRAILIPEQRRGEPCPSPRSSGTAPSPSTLTKTLG